jgi:hypothetical protein
LFPGDGVPIDYNMRAEPFKPPIRPAERKAASDLGGPATIDIARGLAYGFATEDALRSIRL